jgi:hypothetical protein
VNQLSEILGKTDDKTLEHASNTLNEFRETKIEVSGD